MESGSIASANPLAASALARADDIWITALTLAVLEKRFGDRKDESALIIFKVNMRLACYFALLCALS